MPATPSPASGTPGPTTVPLTVASAPEATAGAMQSAAGHISAAPIRHLAPRNPDGGPTNPFYHRNPLVPGLWDRCSSRSAADRVVIVEQALGDALDGLDAVVLRWLLARQDRDREAARRPAQEHHLVDAPVRPAGPTALVVQRPAIRRNRWDPPLL